MQTFDRQTAAALATAILSASAVGALCAHLADGHWLTGAFLLATPFALVGAALSLLAAVASKYLRWLSIPGFALLAFWGIVQVWPTSPADAPAPPRDQSPCASEAPPDRPIDVVTWNTHGKRTREEARVLARSIQADVLLLQEVGSPDFVDEVAREWNGVGTFSPTLWGFGLGVVVRDGAPGRCFGADRHLIRELPATGRRRAVAMLAYARFEAGGTLPVVVFHNDRPANLSEVRTWPNRLHGSARVVSRLAVDLPAVVVGGDSNAPHEFRRFGGIVASAGLERATPFRTWPAHLRNVPSIPIYALDGLWVGPHWQIDDTERPSIGLESDHRALSVRLTSSGPTVSTDDEGE